MKKITTSILALGIMLVPIQTSFASNDSTTETGFTAVRLKEVVERTSLSLYPTVGSQTIKRLTEASQVTARMDERIVSFYGDISMTPPSDWQSSEFISEDGIISTYIYQEEVGAQVAVFRKYGEGISKDSVVAEMELLCEVCGYTLEEKDEVTFLDQDATFLDIITEEQRFNQYIFEIDEVVYLVEIAAPVSEWNKYRRILRDSAESIEIINTEAIIDTSYTTLEIDTGGFEEILAFVEAAEYEQASNQIMAAVVNPDTNPFLLYAYSVVLFHYLENREQAAFVFYLAQLRSGAYATADRDPSGSAALRFSLNMTVGEFINLWVGSDIEAWKKLVQDVIAFDGSLGEPFNPFDLQPETWTEVIVQNKILWISGFDEYIMPLTQEEYALERTENGLYVGPWENPGDPLPDEWVL